MLELEDILKIPTYSGREDMLVDKIEDFCLSNKLVYHKDHKNNLYVVKGDAEYYPCVVSHTDTVHNDQENLISENENLEILSKSFDGLTFLTALNNGVESGIGGDDKCGVWICLNLLQKLENIKCAFFTEEEVGMKGSRECDVDFFKNVGYALQFDAPTDNWFSKSCSGFNLWTENFFQKVEPLLKEYGVDNISKDPFTDVVQLRKKFDFCCSVLPTGYYNQHSAHEYVIKEHTQKCLKLGFDFLNTLGFDKYAFEKQPSTGRGLILE